VALAVFRAYRIRSQHMRASLLAIQVQWPRLPCSYLCQRERCASTKPTGAEISPVDARVGHLLLPTRSDCPGAPAGFSKASWWKSTSSWSGYFSTWCDLAAIPNSDIFLVVSTIVAAPTGIYILDRGILIIVRFVIVAIFVICKVNGNGPVNNHPVSAARSLVVANKGHNLISRDAIIRLSHFVLLSKRSLIIVSNVVTGSHQKAVMNVFIVGKDWLKFVVLVRDRLCLSGSEICDEGVRHPIEPGTFRPCGSRRWRKRLLSASNDLLEAC
jgi:hypothetical protein